MLPIVARSARPSVGSPGPKNSTNLETTPTLAEHLGHGEDEVGGGRSLRQLPVQPKPTTCGSSIEIGWPSIAASASIPPTPQPRTPSPLTIVVWESVPTSVSG